MSLRCLLVLSDNLIKLLVLDILGVGANLLVVLVEFQDLVLKLDDFNGLVVLFGGQLLDNFLAVLDLLFVLGLKILNLSLEVLDLISSLLDLVMNHAKIARQRVKKWSANINIYTYPYLTRSFWSSLTFGDSFDLSNTFG